MGSLIISSLFFCLVLVLGNCLIFKQDEKDTGIGFIHEMVKSGRKLNDWTNILCIGNFSDTFYTNLRRMASPSTIVIISAHIEEDVDIEDVVPYAPHTTVINCISFDDFENKFLKTKSSPYWHPLSNIILLYQSTLTRCTVAKIFFILWYYRVFNAIIVQYGNSTEFFTIHKYSPYVSDNYKLQNSFGCWTAKSLGMHMPNFKEGFVCERECHNVTHPSLRTNNLGTCIGYDSHVIHKNDTESLRKLDVFEEKGKNLHGYPMRAYATEIKPFFLVEVHDNKTYSLSSRDGMVWNSISKVMNFTIDLTPSASVLKEPFQFERSIQQIYTFALRKVDLFLIPIYQFDLIIVEVDYTVPIKESGLCLMSHRAGFETNLFDAKLLKDNYGLFIKILFCFLGIWTVFFVFNFVEKKSTSFHQAGKDLSNTIRSILSITLNHPPKTRPFRIYLGTSVWCFFILNFFTQAAIISFFSSFRRGKEVNTFEDVIEKGYIIEGLASPDAMLPDDEERFMKLNSKLVAIQNWYECAKRMANDSHRFCLIDCAVGHYLEHNLLNNEGQQYLHIAERDRFHSNYLNMLLTKHSPITKQYNRLIQNLFEAGLIKKWEEYKYNDIKEEVQIKPLGMTDLSGIFKCYGLLLAVCLFIFVGENATYRIKQYCKNKISNWKNRKDKKKLGKRRVLNIKLQYVQKI